MILTRIIRNKLKQAQENSGRTCSCELRCQFRTPSSVQSRLPSEVSPGEMEPGYLSLRLIVAR